MCSYFSWGTNIENIWLSTILPVAFRSFWITADNRRQPTVHSPLNWTSTLFSLGNARNA
jgi:hypothetical protein